MEITVTLNDLILIVIAVGIMALIVYLIKLVKTLTETATRTNEVLDDVKIISDAAAEKTEQLCELADDITEAAGMITELVKGNQSGVKAVTNIVNSVAGIKNILSRDKKDDKEGKGKKA